jgi:phage-related protein
MVKPPYTRAVRPERHIHFLPPCLKQLKGWPDDVKDITALALHAAALGVKHRDVRALDGYPGISVQEVAIRHRGEAYRVIFTVQFPEALYVLHVFHKKSHRGRATPKHEIDTLDQRLARSAEWRLL